MRLPSFPLPSNITQIIQFKAPTVADCLSMVEIDSRFEEQQTTVYLNRLQISTVNDSGAWTGEDRRTALWWIFINTREDTSLAFQYHCSLCNEDHYPVINLTTLGETAITLNGKAFREITLQTHDKKYAVKVHPLTGYSLEHIEQLKLNRDNQQPGSIAYKKAANIMALYELLHSIDIKGQPIEQNEALVFKRNIIEGLDAECEFRPFAARVEQSLRSLRHGLLSQYNNGQYLLMATRKPCAKEDDSSYPILIPFHTSTFIQNL